MVEKQETAKTQWANVESAYQRRSDLIPNLVNTVKGYADFEKETLEAVIQARANATKTTIDPSNITPEQMAAFQESQNSLSGALSRLMVVVERYPDLKANQNFLELQSQLEGTENRINVERNRFNEQARDYNVYVRKFPASVVAGFLNFEPMALFQAAPGSEQAPTVDFN
jgi:LemA protein